ncbi:hypothetical protein HZ320_00770 [[Pasteurella] aerogenes]|nr:hypothetical protein HZ320_00770 [[Pasteurella] aerogenes]
MEIMVYIIVGSIALLFCSLMLAGISYGIMCVVYLFKLIGLVLAILFNPFIELLLRFCTQQKQS